MVSLADMRRDARAAFDAAVAAVQPRNLIPHQIRRDGKQVRIAEEPLPCPPGRHVVMAIGKAAPGLAAAWLEHVPEWTSELFVLAPHGAPVPPEIEKASTFLRGGHPYPDTDGESSARALLEVARSLGEDDALVVLISGGGSALLAAPEDGLSLDDISTTTELLLKSGAPIDEVNTVRRRLLAAAGGGLGRAAFPAQVQTLVLSDVIGDLLSAVASGPTVPSTSTPSDALSVLDRRGVSRAVPGTVIAFLETTAELPPDDGKCAAMNRIRVIGNNRTAVDAAALVLQARGYEVWKVAEHLVGEARIRGREIAAAARKMESTATAAVVYGGETTVTVRGPGRGGRNQELALAAAIGIDGAERIAVLAAGTDGIDGPTKNAGAVVDPSTVPRLRRLGLDPRKMLDDNDSGTALDAVGDTFETGPTGTNVCDLTLVLAAPQTAN